MLFVLLHGAFHTSSCWDVVRAHLEAEGHKVHTPNLSTWKDNKVIPESAQKIDAYISPAIEYIEKHNLQDIVLVGHSVGSCMNQLIAPHFPSRIRKMIFLSFPIVQPGVSIADICKPESAAFMKQVADQSDDYTLTMPPEAWASSYCNTVSEDEAATYLEHTVRQPYGHFEEKLQTGPFFSKEMEGISKLAVIPNQDMHMVEGWYCNVERKIEDYMKVIKCDGDHEMVFTAPKQLTEVLIKAADAI